MFFFWALGMLSANELAKSSVLMATSLPGIAGLLIVIPYCRNRPRWLSGASLLIILLFFLDAAIKGFLRDHFGLRPNPILVLQAIFNSNPAETSEFLRHNWRDLAQAVAAFALVALAICWAERRLSRSETPPAIGRGGMVTIGSLLTVFLALHFNPTMAKENPLLFWPIRYLDYQAQLAQAQDMQRNVARSMAHRSQWQVRYQGPDANTVVWIIGESINRNNMSLYGYSRNTTPMLDAMRRDLIVFRDVVSSEPATMSSLMKMLTPADLNDPLAWSSKPDMLMLAREAGYRTFWISNQVPNDGWLGLVSGRADEQVFINRGAGRGENNYDGNLLPGLERALDDPTPKKFIVVHLLGAHPTYDMRYPQGFSRFEGVRDLVSEQLTSAGRSMWVRQQRDEYDNAIAYNDFVVANMVQRVMRAHPDRHASVLFSSDHAQEVGHTRDHAGQSVADASGYEIPMFMWTRSFVAKSVDEKAQLEHRPYQTDHLEHTMMALLGIQSSYYRPARDILSDGFLREDFFNGLRRINGKPYEPRSVMY
ncbi:phosphoethanolamine transferase [Herbaspirillum sp. alder98]|uniref:phosphoethanolamine transferase n=1 Tax=Herbaspirillum sp. alder98 TaxID=2913096 RepID=UPI001CD87DEB|nr:phosphoethanolamine transferase [Herbaspirillum sp. alder98]MCA1323678.1 phosphoethanolamine transferase [Herbaspirillum sp. alder98]